MSQEIQCIDTLALDNKTHARNNVVDKTLEYWESCKNLFNISPKMDARDLVFIGLRSSEKEEVALIEENSIKKILVEEVRDSGCEPVIETTLDYLGECDSIYISLDVDSMDPDITSYGTGTPVKNGLLPEEVITLVSEFLKDNRIKVLELCEINPLLDDKNKMAELSLNILEKIIKIINKG